MNNTLYTRALMIISVLMMPVTTFAHPGHGTSGSLHVFDHVLGGGGISQYLLIVAVAMLIGLSIAIFVTRQSTSTSRKKKD